MAFPDTSELLLVDYDDGIIKLRQCQPSSFIASRTGGPKVTQEINITPEVALALAARLLRLAEPHVGGIYDPSESESAS
jgi:hypothetical protein